MRQIQRCVKSLSESGLIIEVGRYKLGNSRDARKWRVNQEAIDTAIIAYDNMIASLSRDKMSHEPPCDILSDGERTSCRLIAGDTMSDGPNARRTESRADSNDGFNGFKVLKTSSKTVNPSDHRGLDRIEQLDGEARTACIALMVKSLNQRATSDEVVAAYQAALNKGYTPDQISQAYDRYIARYRRDNPETTRFAMRLDNYLTRGDGLRFDMPKPARRKETRPPAAGSTIEQAREARISALREKYPEYNEMVSKRTALYARHGKAMLLKDEESVRAYTEQIAEISKAIEKFEATHGEPHENEPKEANLNG